MDIIKIFVTIRLVESFFRRGTYRNGKIGVYEMIPIHQAPVTSDHKVFNRYVATPFDITLTFSSTANDIWSLVVKTQFFMYVYRYILGNMQTVDRQRCFACIFF